MSAKVKLISSSFISRSILLLCNVRSIEHKWPLFKVGLEAYNPKVIVLVESWLSEYTVNIYKYKNFQQFSMSRVSKSGGGVMLFLHPSYSAVRVNAPRIM